MTLVCQSPSEPFQSQLSKDWQKVQGKFIIYSGHIINSTKAKEFNSKTQKQAQCREQGTRGPQSLLHTYRAMGPHLPSGSSLPCSDPCPPTPTLHSQCPSSATPGSHLQGPGPSPPSPTQAGELLLCFPNSAHLSPPSHLMNHSVPRALEPLPGPGAPCTLVRPTPKWVQCILYLPAGGLISLKDR